MMRKNIPLRRTSTGDYSFSLKNIFREKGSEGAIYGRKPLAKRVKRQKKLEEGVISNESSKNN